MGKKPTSQQSPLSLHYSRFMRRVVERDKAGAPARWMHTKMPARSGTYWTEHIVGKDGGEPIPLNMGDLAIIADVLRIDPFDLVTYINTNNLDAVPRFPGDGPKLTLVGGRPDDEPDPLPRDQERDVRDTEKVAALKRPRNK